MLAEIVTNVDEVDLIMFNSISNPIQKSNENNLDVVQLAVCLRVCSATYLTLVLGVAVDVVVVGLQHQNPRFQPAMCPALFVHRLACHAMIRSAHSSPVVADPRDTTNYHHS